MYLQMSYIKGYYVWAKTEEYSLKTYLALYKLAIW